MADVSFDKLLIMRGRGGGSADCRVPARLRVPAVVLEIVTGIVLGPSLLGWVHVDLPV